MYLKKIVICKLLWLIYDEKSYIGYVFGNSGEDNVTELARVTTLEVPLEGQFAER